MKIAAYLAVIAVCAFSSTFAEEPQAPAAKSDAAAVSAPDTAATATPPAPDKSPAEKAAAEKAAADAQIKTMRGRGYKPSTRNGVTVYCRAEGQLGTHFEKQHCSTMDELKQAELTGKEYVNSIQQQGSATPFKGP